MLLIERMARLLFDLELSSRFVLREVSLRFLLQQVISQHIIIENKSIAVVLEKRATIVMLRLQIDVINAIALQSVPVFVHGTLGLPL